MAQGRNLKMTDILSHPMGFVNTRQVAKKDKQSIFSYLSAENVTVAEELPDHSATVDGMNLV